MKLIKCSCGIIVGAFVDAPENKHVLKEELKHYILTYNNECARNEFNFIVPLPGNKVCCKYCYRKMKG